MRRIFLVKTRINIERSFIYENAKKEYAAVVFESSVLFEGQASAAN